MPNTLRKRCDPTGEKKYPGATTSRRCVPAGTLGLFTKRNLLNLNE